jgi:RHS repeat-associated protein
VVHAAVYDVYNGTITSYTSASHYSYDIHGNVKELIQEIPELGVLDDLSSNFYQRYKQVKYSYDLVSGNVNQVSYQAGSADQFYHKYRYDADNRVVAAYTSADGKVWDQEAKYFYYVHGPLARVELANDKVQGMDFAYTIQGWIKQVNSTGLTAAHDMGKDAGTGVNKWVGADEMGFGLTYFSGDYTSIAATTAIASQTGSGLHGASANLYNGNIKNMVTSIKAFASPTAMAYKYDQLNRIRSAEYFTNYTAGTNTWDATGGSTDFKENFTFDHNGNIITQKRNGSAAQSGVALDDLKYYYYNAAGGIYDPSTGSTPSNATNKLAYVTDAIASGYTDDIDNQAVNNYTYDQIGQLKSDAQEQIATIDWTVYNKIRSVTRSTGSTKPDLEFKYDAMGQRMVKVAKPRAGGSPNTQEFWTYTYYVRDAQGNVLGVYERSLPKAGATYTDQIKLKEQNMYGSSRLGTKNPDLLLTSKSYTFTSYNGLLLNGTAGAQTTTTVSLTSVVHKINQKVFEMSNHLGNVLVTVSDARVPVNGTGSVGSYGAIVRAGMEYSAFGVVRRTIANNGNYRYGFNGKEMERELHNNSGDAYDFGARIYDGRLGKWLSCDRFEEKYPDISPYIFSANCPIAVIDIGGDSIYIVTANGVFNLSTAEGRGLAQQYGYGILIRTTHGKQLLEKYQNSSQYDIYVSTAPQSMGNDGARTSALPLNSASGNTGDLSLVYGKGTPFTVFNNMKLKNPKNEFALMVFNPDYIQHKGIFSTRTEYDIAETFYHEIKTHIDYQQESIVWATAWIKKTPELANKSDLIAIIQHHLYGVDHNNNLGLDVAKVRPGSDADVIRKEIKLLMKYDSAAKELMHYIKNEVIPTVTDPTGAAGHGNSK